MVIFDELDTADAGTHCDSNGVAIFFGYLKTGMLYRLYAGTDAVVNKWIGLARILGGEVFAQIKVIDDTANASWVRTGIKVFDQLYT